MPQAILIAGAVAATAVAGAGGAVLGAAVITIGATTITVGTLAAAAISAGSSLLAASMASDGQVQPRVGRETAVAESAGRRWRVLGRARLAGAWTLYDASTSGDLWQLLDVAHHRIDAIESHLLDGEPVTLDGDGWVTSPAKWAGRVQIRTKLGAHVQGFEDLVDAFPYWTPAHVGRGVAQVLIRQRRVPRREIETVYPRRRLDWTGVVKGDAQVLDPRTGLRGWTDNSALHVLRFLTLSPQEGGMGLPLARIDIGAFRAAADVCDQSVPLKAGGTERRWRTNGVLEMNADRRAALGALLAACDGELVAGPDGRWGLQLSRRERVAKLTEDEVLAVQWSRGAEAWSRPNRGVARFVSEAHGWVQMTTPPRDLPRAPGEDVRETSVDLPLVASSGQAQRLVKRALLDEAPAFRCELVTNLGGRAVRQGVAVELDVPQAPAGVVYHVQRRRVDVGAGRVTFELVALHPDREAWDREDLPITSAPVISATDGVLTAPAGVDATAVVIKLAGGAAGDALRVRFNALGDDTVQVEMQVAEAGTGEWQTAATGEATSGVITSGVLTRDRAYDARVRFVGPGGRATSWTTIAATDVTALGDVPPTPEAMTATGGENSVTLSARAPATGPVWRMRFFTAPTNSFAAATLVATRAVVNGQTVEATVTASTGFGFAWTQLRSDEDVDGLPTDSASYEVTGATP